jgi:integrase
MSLFKRPGSPYWYMEIQVSGRRIARSTRTGTRREAEAFQRRVRTEAKQEAERIGKGGAARRAVLDYTVDQMFGRYWIEHGSKLRWSAEVAGYAKRIVVIIGGLKVCDMTTADAAHMAETLRDNNTGRVAINRALAVLRGAHTMASKRWGCPTHAIDWRGLRSKEPRERVRWISREEATRLLACVPPHAALIVEFALYTGLRKAEIKGLSWDRYDPAQGYIEVQVKGGHCRRLLISEAAKDVLARAPKNNGRYVFDWRNLRKHFEAGLKLAGIENFRFHDLRHTSATWMRQEGASLELIQRNLGHSSIQVTQRYAHVDDREALAAANAITTLLPPNVVRFQPAPKAQFVYFITDGDHMKIGHSSDPERRLRAAQTCHPKTLWLVGTIAATKITEDAAHRKFADDRLRGEWFSVTGATLKEVESMCRAAKSQHDGGNQNSLMHKGAT